MNAKIKELLQEKYEVIGKAADDCTYILMDDKLTKEEIKNKLYVIFDRINSEMQVLEDYLDAYYKETEKTSISTNTDLKNKILAGAFF